MAPFQENDRHPKLAKNMSGIHTIGCAVACFSGKTLSNSRQATDCLFSSSQLDEVGRVWHASGVTLTWVQTLVLPFTSYKIFSNWLSTLQVSSSTQRTVQDAVKVRGSCLVQLSSTAQSMCQLTRAAVTEVYILAGRNITSLLLTVLEPGSSRSRYWLGWFSLRALCLAYR